MILDSLPDRCEYDVLIVGSGLAAMTTALQLAEDGRKRVLMVTMEDAPSEASASVLAAGGIIYRGDGDPDLLIDDVLISGRNVGYRPAVEQLANLGPEVVRELLIDAVGVRFDTANLGVSVDGFSLTREASHSNDRILHVGDATGGAIMSALGKKVMAHSGVDIALGHMLIDLLTSGHQTNVFDYKQLKNRCLGAYVFDTRTQTVKTILAEHTVLATGGVGQVYKNTVNNSGAIGSGWAVTSTAGVRNLSTRFMQFHPTALKLPGAADGERMHLVTEAVRGEGGRLKTKDGRFLMDGYGKKDLEGRDVVSQAIFKHLQESGYDCVYLDIASFYKGSVPLQERFPTIYAACMKYGIDITREPIPVAPAAHFACGGVVVDLDGKTELDGLYAVGEVSCTGVHGANRLASTSLLECVVWGRQAALSIANSSFPESRAMFGSVRDWEYFPKKSGSSGDALALRKQIQRVMWDKVGIERTPKGLGEAKIELSRLRGEADRLYLESPLSKELLELRHLVRAAQIIAHDAGAFMNRKLDSLGGHLLVDDLE